jgi:DNA polymerase III delta subunit
MVAGQGRRMVKLWLELEAQGERAGSLIGFGTRRLREAIQASERLDAGESVAKVAGSLRMPRRAADTFIADLQRTDTETLRDSLAALADLEADSRGASGPVHESTVVARTLARIST